MRGFLSHKLGYAAAALAAAAAVAMTAVIGTTSVLSSATGPREASRFAVTAETAAVEDRRDTPDSDCECTSVYAFELEALEAEVSRLAQPPKRDKSPIRHWVPSRRQGVRRVWTTFYSVHSDEAVPVLENKLPPAEVFDELFRCRGFGTKKRVDPKLIDAAIAAARHFKSDRIEIISGFRSLKFNDALAKKGRHVATESKHTLGQALDIRIVNTQAEAVGSWLFETFEGGVGVYRRDDFVHIDVGPKRRWRGN